jgi:KUP system potassium uptake protein
MNPRPQHAAGSLPLTLGALGVVFGDIGTSPLYALREAFRPNGLSTSPDHVFGVLSLTFWTLMLVVSIKYAVFVMRADNRGEGGILALLAVLLEGGATGKRARFLTILGLVGAALLLADGTITPAISVLSAVEGLTVATTAVTPWVVPVTLAILFGLFGVQRFGTEKLARFFGPIMLLWFLTQAALGIRWIVRAPQVIAALNPLYGAKLLINEPHVTVIVLGAVVLCVTGAEALYADMGHFGRSPIRKAWTIVVLPALVLNYLGQGAFLLLRQHSVGSSEEIHPFFEMAPAPLIIPLVALATLATVIASQALITGAFSLAQQATELGYVPRLTIVHTSKDVEGQIFVPFVSQLLAVVCALLVIEFKSSSNLAAAYGIAVVTTMFVTTLLLFDVARTTWNWGLRGAVPLALLLLAVDTPLLLANLAKIPAGGWVPLTMGAVLLVLSLTWVWGRNTLADPFVSESFVYPVAPFVEEIVEATRIAGAAVVLTGRADVVPTSFLYHYHRTLVLPHTVVLVTIKTRHVPRIEDDQWLDVRSFGSGIWGVTAHHGFLERIDIAHVLTSCRPHGLELDPEGVDYYLSGLTLVPKASGILRSWRKRLFAFLYHNERSVVSFFNIPTNRVIELGRQVEL